jgi:fructosamine-3-kinase
MAMELIDGINATTSKFFNFSSVKKRKFFTNTVVDALAKIHQTTSDKYGFIGKTERFDTWQEFYKTMLLDVYERTKLFCSKNASGLNDNIIALLETSIRNIDYILSDEVEKPSLLHGDLWVANIMVDEKTFAPTGIIDPLHPMWGDKEFDLFPLNATWGKRFKLYKTYKAKYKTSTNVDLKTALYYFVNEVLCGLELNTWYGSGDAFYNMLMKQLKKQLKKHNLT